MNTNPYDFSDPVRDPEMFFGRRDLLREMLDNFCAPNPVRYRNLAKNLGKVLRRPSFMPTPAFMIRIIMGEFGNVFLGSQRTVPDKLLSHGFSFQYPEIKDAIRAVVSG